MMVAPILKIANTEVKKQSGMDDLVKLARRLCSSYGEKSYGLKAIPGKKRKSKKQRKQQGGNFEYFSLNFPSTP